MAISFTREVENAVGVSWPAITDVRTRSSAHKTGSACPKYSLFLEQLSLAPPNASLGWLQSRVGTRRCFGCLLVVLTKYRFLVWHKRREIETSDRHRIVWRGADADLVMWALIPRVMEGSKQDIPNDKLAAIIGITDPFVRVLMVSSHSDHLQRASFTLMSPTPIRSP